MANTKSQAQRTLRAHNIAGEFTGAGSTYTVEVAEADVDAVRKLLPGMGGYATQYGTYVFDSEYVPMSDDYCQQGTDEQYHASSHTLYDIVS